MVYGYCLLVGKVIPYWDINSVREEKPPYPYVPLLRTCKAVHFEAEPVVYENIFFLASKQAIERLFTDSLPTPARRLLLTSVEISLYFDDIDKEDKILMRREFLEKMYVSGDSCLFGRPSEIHCSQRLFRLRVRPFQSHCYQEPSLPQSCPDSYRISMNQLRGINAWQNKIIPILGNLTLDRLVLDLSHSCCGVCCTYCHSAPMAIMCFKKGFALRAPRVVQVKGWDAGRANVQVMVQGCLELWTRRQAGRVAASVAFGVQGMLEAEKWLDKVFCEEA